MMDSPTRGSRFVFLAFRELSPVQTRIRSPSRSTHTGATCGAPSSISVARWAKFAPRTSALISSESFVAMGTSRRGLLERDRQGGEPAERRRGPPCWRPGDRHAGHPTEERAQGDLSFDPRQWRAEAEVDAEAKRDVAIVASGNVEAIGLREVRRIPIGCADRGDDHRPFGDCAAVDLDVR